MADIGLVIAEKVNVVESFIQATLVAGENITGGQAVKIDPTTGTAHLSNGTAAAEARIFGIALKSVVSGLPVTILRKGVIDGFDVDGNDFDDPIYLSDTDGTLADAAGTVSVVVGRVIPGTAVLLGDGYDKLLFVDL